MTAAPKMIALVFAIAVAFVAAGCGGGDNKAAETETVGAGGETKIDCRADEFSGDPQLPANFPTPGEFVVTSSTQEGPTRVVVGYWEVRARRGLPGMEGSGRGGRVQGDVRRARGARLRGRVRGLGPDRDHPAQGSLQRGRSDLRPHHQPSPNSRPAYFAKIVAR
jgi:hypothetical protein